MVALKENKGLSVTVSDATGQRSMRIRGLIREGTVGEFMKSLLPRMDLPATDSAGRPVVFRLRNEREGRYLYDSETLGDAVQEEDRVTLQPNIDAGAC